MKSPRPTSLLSGFTIIETMIVLAVAGLLIMLVLIAVPTLRRNQRNTARKQFTALLAAQLDTYRGNLGSYPKDSTNGGDNRCNFMTNYAVNGNTPVTCSIIGDCALADNGIYTICFHTRDGNHDYVGDYDEISIELAHGCNTSYSVGSDYIISRSAADNDYNRYVVWTGLETTNPVCVDNVR